MPRKTRNTGFRGTSTTMGFNEAAARCRGKRNWPVDAMIQVLLASMRPRPDAAENRAGTARRTAVVRRFNEAAARCRGKRVNTAPRQARGNSFNEAAARCRGKPARPPLVDRGRAASMRPRPDAAENAYDAVRDIGRGGASMRPRPDAAENMARRTRHWTASCGFNEAAARCRGKLHRLADRARRPPMLQ